MTLRRSLAVSPPDDAVARVQAAMDGLRAELAPLLASEAARLRAVQSLAADEPVAGRAALPAVVHDLKGLGTTCDRPLVTRAAASLERLMLRDAGWTGPIALHVDALLALLGDGPEAARADAGERLAETLERLSAP